MFTKLVNTVHCAFNNMSCGLKNQLAECLAARKMKKSQLAYRLHMSRAYVTRLVRGEIRPSLEAALRIAKDFGKPVEEIFHIEEGDATIQRHFPSVPGCGQDQPKCRKKPK